jgi:hypothetical protein
MKAEFATFMGYRGQPSDFSADSETASQNLNDVFNPCVAFPCGM